MWQRMKQSSLGSNVKVTRVTRPKIDLEAWWRHHSRLLELSTSFRLLLPCIPLYSCCLLCVTEDVAKGTVKNCDLSREDV